jgi:3-oxoacyl-[acyl-carrier protein] reductase
MELGLKNKSMLVSGSSKGIGLAIAESLLQEGARVQISGRDEKILKNTFKVLSERYSPVNIDIFCGDLTQPEMINKAICQLIDRFDGLDGVIANIGSGSGPSGWDLSSSDWHSITDVNLFSSMALATSAIPHLKGRDNPSITFISSIAGVEAISAPIPYSAAKAGLQQAAKNLARLLGPEDIRVNTVAPGNVLVPGGSWDSKLNEKPNQVEKYLKSEVPQGRFADPLEIADAVVFLASARASFISGALLCVDGAQTR